MKDRKGIDVIFIVNHGLSEELETEKERRNHPILTQGKRGVHVYPR